MRIASGKESEREEEGESQMIVGKEALESQFQCFTFVVSFLCIWHLICQHELFKKPLKNV